MGASRTIFRNILSNYAGYVVNMAVALMLSPFVVRTLGDDSYGIWTLLISLTGSYGLLDLGVRSAVGYYLTRYYTKRDQEGVERTMNTALVLMFVAAGIATIITVILAVGFPYWKPEAYEREPNSVLAILIMGLGVAFSFPMALFSTVIYARQRLDLQNLVGICQRLLTAGATVAFLMADTGILGLSIAVMGCSVLGWAANAWLARRLMPELKIRLGSFSRKSFRELKSYGFYNFIVNAADNILLYTDALVIGAVMSLSAVTYYAIGANLIPYYMSIVLAVSWAITPYATAQYAKGDIASLRRLLLLGTRGSTMLGTLLGGGLLLLGHDFLGQWMGWHFVSGQKHPSSAIILAILASATLLRAAQSLARQVLFAMQEVRFLGFLALGESAANLGLSMVLVRTHGIIGVAIGTLIPIVVTQGFIQPFFLARKLDVRPAQFYGAALRGMVPTLLAMDLAYVFFARDLPVDSWAEFLVKATCVGVPGLLAGFLFGLGRAERSFVLGRLRRR